MFSRHGWPDSTKTHFTALKLMGIPLFTSATSHVKFAHERFVTASEHKGTPAWNFIKQAIPLKDMPNYSSTDICHSCVELSIIVGKDSVRQKSILPPRLRGDMATRTAFALDSSFNFALISRILVDKDIYCRYHVIIGARQNSKELMSTTQTYPWLIPEHHLWL